MQDQVEENWCWPVEIDDEGDGEDDHLEQLTDENLSSTSGEC